MDYAALVRELVRALRGARSQRALARRLGFSTNVIYSWESGQRQPTATILFKLAARHGRDVGPDFTRRLGLNAPLGSGALTRLGGIAKLLNALLQGQPVSRIAKRIGVDRSTLNRWLQGRTDPRASDFFMFVEAATLRLIDLIELLVDPTLLSSLRERYSSLLAQRRLAYDLPLSHAVLRALELDGYQGVRTDEASYLAREIGVSAIEASALLDALASAGQIVRNDHKWTLSNIMTVDTRADAQRDLQLKRFWAATALERMKRQKRLTDALCSYNLFAISDEGYERIRQLHLEYYEAVRQVIGTDSSPRRVALMIVQLMPLNGPGN